MLATGMQMRWLSQGATYPEALRTLPIPLSLIVISK